MSLFTSCHLCIINHIGTLDTFGSILLQCLSFFSTWYFQPLLASSSHTSSLTRSVAVETAPLAVGYLRKLFGKEGLWTQPTLFGRGELPRMVQPMQWLRCQNAE